MPIDPNAKVSELALTVPNAPHILDELHVDYCCHGSQSLAAACADAGVPLSVAMALLEGEPRPSDKIDAAWVDAPLTDLIDYIERKHHPFTRAEIVRLPKLAAKVVRAHGERHPELARVEQIVLALAAELEPHLDKEERILFPAVRHLVRVGAQGGAVDVLPPIAVMRQEHDVVGDLLRDVRRTTDEFELSPDACASFKALYEGIDGLDRDIRYHVHLENNVLFPRALALAGGAA
jgi:regulator of cell morphogenesis and NO signaling